MTNFRNNKALLRIACLFVTISFLSNAVLPGYARAQDLVLPSPTQFVQLSGSYSFPVLKGLKFDPSKPFNMQFIIDTADQKDIDKEEASRLIRYFFAGLAIPEQDTWVNMSAYEKDRVIPSSLADTDLGKDLLSLDYILKQVSVSLTYPESEIGKDFWSKTYAAVLNVAHTTNLPVNTFNKIWIMPDKAEVYEHDNFALVHEATLKTMLEADYLALKNNITDIQKQKKGMKDELIEKINQASSNVMREFILPKINQDVNSGKNFATLRQIYYSLILGVWFKKKFKDSIYKYYINQGKVKGIDINDKNAKDKIYNLYIQGLQKGLYNYIKSDYDPGTRRNIKRQYFSGGFTAMNLASSAIVTPASNAAMDRDLSHMLLVGSGRLVSIAESPVMAGQKSSGSPVDSAQFILKTNPKRYEEVFLKIRSQGDSAQFDGTDADKLYSLLLGKTERVETIIPLQELLDKVRAIEESGKPDKKKINDITSSIDNITQQFDNIFIIPDPASFLNVNAKSKLTLYYDLGDKWRKITGFIYSAKNYLDLPDFTSADNQKVKENLSKFKLGLDKYAKLLADIKAPENIDLEYAGKLYESHDGASLTYQFLLFYLKERAKEAGSPMSLEEYARTIIDAVFDSLEAYPNQVADFKDLYITRAKQNRDAITSKVLHEAAESGNKLAQQIIQDYEIFKAGGKKSNSQIIKEKTLIKFKDANIGKAASIEIPSEVKTGKADIVVSGDALHVVLSYDDKLSLFVAKSKGLEHWLMTNWTHKDPVWASKPELEISVYGNTLYFTFKVDGQYGRKDLGTREFEVKIVPSSSKIVGSPIGKIEELKDTLEFLRNGLGEVTYDSKTSLNDERQIKYSSGKIEIKSNRYFSPQVEVSLFDLRGVLRAYIAYPYSVALAVKTPADIRQDVIKSVGQEIQDYLDNPTTPEVRVIKEIEHEFTMGGDKLSGLGRTALEGYVYDFNALPEAIGYLLEGQRYNIDYETAKAIFISARLELKYELNWIGRLAIEWYLKKKEGIDVRQFMMSSNPQINKDKAETILREAEGLATADSPVESGESESSMASIKKAIKELEGSITERRNSAQEIWDKINANEVKIDSFKHDPLYPAPDILNEIKKLEDENGRNYAALLGIQDQIRKMSYELYELRGELTTSGSPLNIKVPELNATDKKRAEGILSEVKNIQEGVKNFEIKLKKSGECVGCSVELGRLKTDAISKITNLHDSLAEIVLRSIPQKIGDEVTDARGRTFKIENIEVPPSATLGDSILKYTLRDIEGNKMISPYSSNYNEVLESLFVSKSQSELGAGSPMTTRQYKEDFEYSIRNSRNALTQTSARIGLLLLNPENKSEFNEYFDSMIENASDVSAQVLARVGILLSGVDSSVSKEFREYFESRKDSRYITTGLFSRIGLLLLGINPSTAKEFREYFEYSIRNSRNALTQTSARIGLLLMRFGDKAEFREDFEYQIRNTSDNFAQTLARIGLVILDRGAGSPIVNILPRQYSFGLFQEQVEKLKEKLISEPENASLHLSLGKHYLSKTQNDFDYGFNTSAAQRAIESNLKNAQVYFRNAIKFGSQDVIAFAVVANSLGEFPETTLGNEQMKKATNYYMSLYVNEMLPKILGIENIALESYKLSIQAKDPELWKFNQQNKKSTPLGKENHQPKGTGVTESPVEFPTGRVLATIETAGKGSYQNVPMPKEFITDKTRVVIYEIFDYGTLKEKPLIWIDLGLGINVKGDSNLTKIDDSKWSYSTGFGPDLEITIDTTNDIFRFSYPTKDTPLKSPRKFEIRLEPIKASGSPITTTDTQLILQAGQHYTQDELKKIATASAKSGGTTFEGSQEQPVGGIDMANINVDAAPGSSPIYMPPINPATFQGITFHIISIIKIGPMMNLSSIFEPTQKLADDASPKKQLAYLKE